MKLAIILVPVAILSIPMTLPAQFGRYGVTKEAFFTQTNSAQPSASSRWTFRGTFAANSSNEVTSVRITPPARISFPMYGSDQYFSYFSGEYDSRTRLDEAYPDGNYAFSITSGTLAPSQATVTIPDGGIYPADVPYFTGSTFSQLQLCDPSATLSFTWNQLAPHPSASDQFMDFFIQSTESGSTTVFSSYSSSVTGFTSATVLSGTLAANTAYRATLVFSNFRRIADAGFGDFDSSADFSYITDMNFVTGDAFPALHAIYSFVQNQTVLGGGRVTHTGRRGYLVYDPDSERGTELIAFVRNGTNKVFAVIPFQQYRVDHLNGAAGATYTVIAQAESPSTKFTDTLLQAVYLRGRDSNVTLMPGLVRRLPKTLAGWARDITLNRNTVSIAASESSGTYTLNLRASMDSNTAGETFAETVARLASSFVARGYSQISPPPTP